MKHVHINSVPDGSTGKIMLFQHRTLLDAGEESYVFWGRGRAAQNDSECKFCFDYEVFIDAFQTRLDDRAGFHSKIATRRLIARLDYINPDVVHLHNLHGYYVNIEMLFDWLASHDCQVIWTLHDCWAFTGHCAYFTYAECDKWETGCYDCPQVRDYPAAWMLGACKRNYIDKRRVFTSISSDRMIFVAPSYWMKGLVERSYFEGYPIEVRHNQIDRKVFKPTQSCFRQKYNIGEKVMILGVANTWSERKGLGDFIKLAHMLDAERYVIVLVGLSRKQIRNLPNNIIGIERTSSAEQLAAIYTASDYFFNPTREDNFPTVNLEAEACGTPVITYDCGGCSETLSLDCSFSVASFQDALHCFIRNER